jgi:DNA-binding response OmpR family regulator
MIDMTSEVPTEDRLELLLGNSEGLLNSLIENLIQEIYSNARSVHSTRVTRFDQFVSQATAGAFDLLILIPNNLISEHTGLITGVPIQDGARAIRAVKRERSTPLLAIPLFEHRQEEEETLREAGADGVLEIPFTCEDLKAMVSMLLRRPVAVEV